MNRNTPVQGGRSLHGSGRGWQNWAFWHTDDGVFHVATVPTEQLPTPQAQRTSSREKPPHVPATLVPTQQLDCQGGHTRHTCRAFAPPSRTVHGPTRVCDHTRVVSSPHEVPPTKPRQASKFSGAESKPSAVAPSCFPNRLFLVQGGKE